ncbi:MAG: hypothetical protein GXO65_04730 [Euryarchaeota archaeon]|nr:hypothetical protein [Euryarchaeota archaeon]
MTGRCIGFASFVIVLGILVTAGSAHAVAPYISNGTATFTTIQEAVDNTTAGGTISISGTYTENVDVYKPLNIVGDGTATTIITANNTADHVFNVTASNVNISNLTVTNATGAGKAGIYLANSNSSTIQNVNASGNYYGIYLYSSPSNTLTNNIASNTTYGIYLYSSNNNTLINNTADLNSRGIYLSSSNYNTLTGNTANSNTNGIYLSYSYYTTISGGTANSNSEGMYIRSSSFNTVTGAELHNNTNAGIYDIAGGFAAESYQNFSSNHISGSSNGIYMGSEDNSIISGNSVWNCTYGIYNDGSAGGNVFSSNTLYNNTYGYYFSSSSGDTISGGSVTNNSGPGIYLSSSSNNRITGVTVSYNNLGYTGWGGVYVTSSNSNILSRNTIDHNPEKGVLISSSTGNIIDSNQIIYNCGGVDGIRVESSDDTIVTNNNVSYGTGYGIEISSSNNVTISGNTLEANAGVEIAVWSSQNGTIVNNTIRDTGMTSDGLQLSSSSGFVIASNRITGMDNGIYLAGTADKNKLIGNNLTSNTYGVYSITTGQNNSVLFNTISGNTNGVANTQTTFNLNAVMNYWGSTDGPSGAANGSGDTVSANVSYLPYLSTATNSGTSGTAQGTGTLDMKSLIDTEVDYDASCPVDVTVSIYSSNPGGSSAFATDIGYLDLYVPDASCLNNLTLRYYYTAAQVAGKDESSLKIAFYNSTANTYVECSNTGVNTTDTGNYSGYIWVFVNATTVPTKTDLTGTVFGIGGGIAASAGGTAGTTSHGISITDIELPDSITPGSTLKLLVTIASSAYESGVILKVPGLPEGWTADEVDTGPLNVGTNEKEITVTVPEDASGEFALTVEAVAKDFLGTAKKVVNLAVSEAGGPAPTTAPPVATAPPKPTEKPKPQPTEKPPETPAETMKPEPTPAPAGEAKGICGPSLVAAVALLPVLFRRKLRQGHHLPK